MKWISVENKFPLDGENVLFYWRPIDHLERDFHKEMLVGTLGYMREGEVWINGSFLTEKMNPEDVDLVLLITAEFYENGTEEQRKTVDWLNSNLKDLYSCHSYLLMEWPKGHSQYWIGQYYHSYWMKQFGFSRGDEMKGIAVIALQGGGHD